MSPKRHPKKIAIAISGGVDSSVAALILQQQGYDLYGFFMNNWHDPDQAICQALEDDRIMAETVCDTLGIPFTVVDYSQAYRDRVFDDFLQDHLKGLTPNPDVLCNREIKFKALLDEVLSMGCDCLATGHHAQIQSAANGTVALYKGADPNKDQSYFLAHLDQHQLQHALFPIGHLTKDQVRQLAAQHGLPNHRRKDSTGLCFIGERPFQAFLSEYIIDQPGPIVDEHGTVLGQHRGLMYHTLGQRQGLGIGGRRGSEKPWYVAQKRPKTRELVVVCGDDHPRLFQRDCWIDTPHWIAGHPPDLTQPLTVKIRYRQANQPCTLHLAPSQSSVVFDLPQRAVTPGQFAVFYQNDQCLGAAVIQNKPD